MVEGSQGEPPLLPNAVMLVVCGTRAVCANAPHGSLSVVQLMRHAVFVSINLKDFSCT